MPGFVGGLKDVGRAGLRVLASPFTTAGRFMLWLSTVNVEVLRGFPSDRAKYVGLGGAVFTTASMAGVSAAFALHMAVKLPMAGAVIFGVLWGLAIMSFDRWLVAASGRGVRGLPLMALRLLIAILIGIVVSTPITLRIFQPEIEAEIPTIHSKAAAAFTDQQHANDRGKRITFLNSEITTLTGELSPAPFDPTKDPAVVAAKKAYEDAQKAYDDAQTAYTCETNGGRTCPGGVGGTGNAGEGPVAQQLKTDMDQKKTTRDTDWTAYQTALATGQTNYTTNSGKTSADVQKRIDADRTELDGLNRQVDIDTAKFNAQNNDNGGLLIRLEALDELTADHPAMRAAHIFLLLFFTVIECLPVLLKTIMSFGPKNDYELGLEEYNAARLAVARSSTRNYRTAEIIAGGDLLTEAQAAREQRDQVIADLTERTVAYQADLATTALDGWYRRQRERVERDPEEYLRAGPEPAPTITTPYRPGSATRGNDGDDDGVPDPEDGDTTPGGVPPSRPRRGRAQAPAAAGRPGDDQQGHAFRDSHDDPGATSPSAGTATDQAGHSRHVDQDLPISHLPEAVAGETHGVGVPAPRPGRGHWRRTRSQRGSEPASPANGHLRNVQPRDDDTAYENSPHYPLDDEPTVTPGDPYGPASPWPDEAHTRQQPLPPPVEDNGAGLW
jgi:hypothetical protein